MASIVIQLGRKLFIRSWLDLSEECANVDRKTKYEQKSSALILSLSFSLITELDLFAFLGQVNEPFHGEDSIIVAANMHNTLHEECGCHTENFIPDYSYS